MEHVNEAAMQAALGKVFMLFGGFWIVVLVILFLGVGALMKKRDQLLHARKHADH